ncbi:DsbA family protein [Pseudonocardia hispaniensis]|uniref:DsbA family protein n=1 Tax=Pseudonocardia hispaniensis TaxID=904933 RepID=A0ABW1J012_9PSEU
MANQVTHPDPGVLQVWSDLLCPFAHVAMCGLRAARAELPPGDPAAAVQFEHHVFPLELFNGPHPRRGTDSEAVGLGQIVPAAGFRLWTAPDDRYPHTVLLAAEAVLAASAQSLAAADALDAALRTAFWSQSRSISHRQVILEVAGEAAAAQPEAGLDVEALTADLDTGRYRATLFGDYAIAQTDAIAGSPTILLPDGSSAANPGICVHWEGPWAAGFPVVDAYDPTVYADLLRRAAVGAPADATRVGLP